MAGWQRSTRRPPQMRMQNRPPFIIDRLSPGVGSQGGVFHKCSNIYIYIPPDWGMLNRYFSPQETPRSWRVRACPSYPQLGGGGYGVVYWTRTLQHRDSNIPQKMTKYITCGISLTCAAPTPSAQTLPGAFLDVASPYTRCARVGCPLTHPGRCGNTKFNVLPLRTLCYIHHHSMSSIAAAVTCFIEVWLLLICRFIKRHRHPKRSLILLLSNLRFTVA